MGFTNQTIVITGASAGIGQALALELARQGAKLVLAARNQVALDKTVAACLAQGGEAIAVPTDVTQPDACEQLIQRTIAQFGRLDCLVNNAGIGMISRFDAVTDLTVFDRIMQVNYLGAVYCTHYALPYLKTSRGLLVAVSSLCGKTGVPTRTGYVASKHAMQGFFDTLRIELLESGVDVLVASPGFVATSIRERVLGADGQPLGQSPRDESKHTMPVEECVRQLSTAMAQRKREQVMTLKGKLMPVVKFLWPGLVDRLAMRSAQLKSDD